MCRSLVDEPRHPPAETMVRVIAAVGVLTAGSASAAHLTQAQMTRLTRLAYRYQKLNDECRGGPGLPTVCAARDRAARILEHHRCFPYSDADTLGKRESVKCPWMREELG